MPEVLLVSKGSLDSTAPSAGGKCVVPWRSLCVAYCWRHSLLRPLLSESGGDKKQKPAGCNYTDLPIGILTAFPIWEIWSKQEKWGTRIQNKLFPHRQISVDRQELRGWQWPCVRFSVVPRFTDFTISRNYSCQIKCSDLLFTPRKPRVWKGLAVTDRGIITVASFSPFLRSWICTSVEREAKRTVDN